MGDPAGFMPWPYGTVARAASLSGITEKAIRRKIEEGKWVAGREYRRSPDGGIYISIKGFQSWVEKDQGSSGEKPASASRSPSKASSNATR